MAPARAPIAAEDEAQGRGISLTQVATIVWAYRKISAIIAVSFILLAAGVIKLLPKTFTSTAQLMVNYQVNDPLGGSEFPTTLLAGYMATQVQIMQSPEVFGAVVDELKLTENKEFTAGYNGKTSLRDYAKSTLAKKLDISSGQSGSQLLYVTASSSDPGVAAQIANAIATTYASQQVRRLTDPAVERAERYTKELEDLKQKVDIAQDRVSEFRRRTGIPELGVTESEIEQSKLNSLDVQLLDAQNQRRAFEAKRSENQGSTTQVMNSPVVTGLKSQLSTLEAELAQARTTLGEQHPRIIELRSRIETTKQSIQKEVGAYSDNANTELTAARELEAKLLAARNQQKAQVMTVRSQMDEGKKLLLELDSAKQSYKGMLDNFDKVKAAATGGYTNVSIASRAEVPVQSTKPKKAKLLILAVFGGIFLGMAAPLLYELLLNRRIRCRDDLEKDMGIPVLAELNATQAAGAVG